MNTHKRVHEERTLFAFTTTLSFVIFVYPGLYEPDTIGLLLTTTTILLTYQTFKRLAKYFITEQTLQKADEFTERVVEGLR